MTSMKQLRGGQQRNGRERVVERKINIRIVSICGSVLTKGLMVQKEKFKGGEKEGLNQRGSLSVAETYRGTTVTNVQRKTQ